MEPTLLFVNEDPGMTDEIARGIGELRPRWRVLRACSCHEAKNACRGFFPSAAVVEAVLPDGDGFDLAAELRSVEPRLPVIMIAGEKPAPAIPGLVDGLAYILMGRPASISDIITNVERETHAACLVSQSGNGKPRAGDKRNHGTTTLARLPEQRQLARSDFYVVYDGSVFL